MISANDFRNAWRRIGARPGNSALAVGILSIGLLATMFLFGSINVMVLRPLPFPEAERLVRVGWMQPLRSSEIDSLNTQDWLTLRESMQMFDRIAVDSGQATINIARDVGVKRYSGAIIDAELLSLLGALPLLGRAFDEDDDRSGAPLTVLIGERAWRNDFDADPAIVGQAIRANGEAATIIGVMPAWFTYPTDQDAWIPRQLAPGDDRSNQLTARLAPDVSLQQAQTRLTELGKTLGSQLVGAADGSVLGVHPLHHSFVDETTRYMLWMMFGAGVLVLLLACMNVANLQLAAILPRRRELAVRSALGANRGRLIRELMAEALLLAGMATLLAAIGNDLLSRAFTVSMQSSGLELPFFVDMGYDWRDFLFVPVVALLSCLLAGLIPALRAGGTDAQEALRNGNKGSHGGFFARVSRGLVVAEIALTVVLLVGAAMFIRGIDGMIRFDLGSTADPESIISGRIGVFESDYPEGVDQVRFFESVVERLRKDSQVLAVSAASGQPGWNSGGGVDLLPEGQGKPERGYVSADVAHVDVGFADVYGLRLREGRFIDSSDGADSTPVVIVDRRVAERLWPNGSPLGQRLVLDPDSESQRRAHSVVGVIDHLHLRPLTASRRGSVLVPMAQSPVRFATIAARVQGDAEAFAPTLARAVQEVDADVPAYWLRTQAEATRLGRAGAVVLTQMFVIVGVLTLILAAAGLYGVLAFSVEQRTREIGIRRAIGADGNGVAGLVFRRVLRQLTLGLAIGIGLALPWSALLADPALNTRAYDPVIFVGVVTLVVVVTACAALAPLFRALRVDPMAALRHD